MSAAALLLGALLAAASLPVQPLHPPAQQAPRAPATPRPGDPVPPTRLGEEVLSESPVVVVGRVISVREAGLGTVLMHVRILERMRGAACKRGDELQVLTSSDQFLFGSEDLLFLRPYRGAGRYEVVQRINSADPHYAAKLSIARRTIWLTEIRDPDQRADATLDLLLSLLTARDEWQRGHAVEELTWMVREQGWVFTEARRARLESVARGNPDPGVRAGVERVTSLLTSQDGRSSGAPQKEQSRP